MQSLDGNPEETESLLHRQGYGRGLHDAARGAGDSHGVGASGGSRVGWGGSAASAAAAAAASATGKNAEGNHSHQDRKHGAPAPTARRDAEEDEQGQDCPTAAPNQPLPSPSLGTIRSAVAAVVVIVSVEVCFVVPLRVTEAGERAQDAGSLAAVGLMAQVSATVPVNPVEPGVTLMVDVLPELGYQGRR